MTQQNVIRGVFSQKAKTASKMFSPLSDLSIANNRRTHFKDYLLDNDLAQAVASVIQANRGLSVPEFTAMVAEQRGQDITDPKVNKAIGRFIRLFLVETSVGHTLASNGFVSLTPIGGKPRWYNCLSVTAQALVQTRTYADNVARIGYSMDTSVPTVIGSQFSTFRNDYLRPSGFGRTRWLSQVSLQAVKRNDANYVTFAIDDAKARAEIVTQAAKLREAERVNRAAQTSQERMASQIDILTAQTAIILARTGGAPASTVAVEVPDESVTIRAEVPVPVAAKTNRNRRRGTRRPKGL